MSKPVIFLGSSEQIIDICETVDLLGIEIAGIIDDDYYGNTSEFDGIPYIGSEKNSDWEELKTKYDFFIGVSSVPDVPRNVEKRKNFIRLIDEYHLPCVNVIDPDCRISPRAKLGQGIYVAYGAHISYNCVVGDHCQIHCNTAIAHDTILGRNVIMHRATSTMTYIKINDNAYVAPWAKLLKKNSTIGADSFIKMGVMVFRDVEPGEIIGATGKKIYSMLAETLG